MQTLAHGVQEAGRYHFAWSGTDGRGGVVNSGVFFIRFKASGFERTRIIALMR